MNAPRSMLLQLFVAERRRVIGVVRRIVGCGNTAEDIAHDTLLRLWHHPIGVGDRSLVFRTAQNLALEHLRKQRVRSAYAHEEGRVVDGGESLIAQPDAVSTTAQELDLLLATLQSLPERTQRIFLLNRVDELSYAAISQQLGLSVSTVEKAMMQALDACRRALADRGVQ